MKCIQDLREALSKYFLSKRYHTVIVSATVVDLILTSVEISIALSFCGCAAHHEAAEREPPHGVEVFERIMAFEATIVSGLFVLDHIIRAWALGFVKAFEGQPLEVMEAIVMAVSFGLTVAFMVHDRAAAQVPSLLIGLRLWRLVEIIEAADTLETARQHRKHAKSSRHGSETGVDAGSRVSMGSAHSTGGNRSNRVSRNGEEDRVGSSKHSQQSQKSAGYRGGSISGKGASIAGDPSRPTDADGEGAIELSGRTKVGIKEESYGRSFSISGSGPGAVRGGQGNGANMQAGQDALEIELTPASMQSNGSSSASASEDEGCFRLGDDGEQPLIRWKAIQKKAESVYRSFNYQLFVVVLVVLDLVVTIVATGLALTYCGCSEDARPQLVARLEEALGIEAVVVASIFMAEQAFKFIGLGYRRALKGTLDWLDLVVVLVTFVLSVTLLALAREGVEIAGLVTLLRLWRLVKVAQGTQGLVVAGKMLVQQRTAQSSTDHVVVVEQEAEQAEGDDSARSSTSMSVRETRSHSSLAGAGSKDGR